MFVITYLFFKFLVLTHFFTGPYTKTEGILSYPEICAKLINPNHQKGMRPHLRKVTDPSKRFGKSPLNSSKWCECDFNMLLFTQWVTSDSWKKRFTLLIGKFEASTPDALKLALSWKNGLLISSSSKKAELYRKLNFDNDTFGLGNGNCWKWSFDNSRGIQREISFNVYIFRAGLDEGRRFIPYLWLVLTFRRLC